MASSALVDGVKTEALNAVLIKTAESVNFITHLLCVGLTLKRPSRLIRQVPVCEDIRLTNKERFKLKLISSRCSELIPFLFYKRTFFLSAHCEA
ncbi:hypothetical protein BFV94_3132 [Alteromonas macleodii]|uniref:Uncharacterized protein n=1 Tax=Alteromonas macleodii TaxID=28108 RepID=A0AB36FVL5_ALTMA|nr:hypothetical protein BFV93_3121 [Alteromonas macleodii]OES28841.1 hypothetical protein BFV94_3132 [Alteromonas macleodii]OES29236.1 hypothetical protein BFV95_3132 [Alteromonas macleodii]OES40261.1 hypothetical protein BFV96_3114 [Alteromonas macleodii]